MTSTHPDAAPAPHPSSIWAGAVVVLRAYEPEDWEQETQYEENSADQRSGWKAWPPRSRHAHQAWCREAAEDKPEGDAVQFRLAIARRTDRLAVGAINVHDVDVTNGTFMYGVAVGERYQGNGYGAEAVLLVMRYMFDERRFQKCEAGVYDFNDASLALHRRLGFLEEGRLRRHVFSGGRYHDEIRFGMTAEEFRERYPHLAPVL